MIFELAVSPERAPRLRWKRYFLLSDFLAGRTLLLGARSCRVIQSLYTPKIDVSKVKI